MFKLVTICTLHFLVFNGLLVRSPRSVLLRYKDNWIQIADINNNFVSTNDIPYFFFARYIKIRMMRATDIPSCRPTCSHGSLLVRRSNHA